MNINTREDLDVLVDELGSAANLERLASLLSELNPEMSITVDSYDSESLAVEINPPNADPRYIVRAGSGWEMSTGGDSLSIYADSFTRACDMTGLFFPRFHNTRPNEKAPSIQYLGTTDDLIALQTPFEGTVHLRKEAIEAAIAIARDHRPDWLHVLGEAIGEEITQSGLKV